MKTLVIGLPGTGKTTYVKNNLRNGLVYDLDAIAAAVRLAEPHEEHHSAARQVANDLLSAFLDSASKCTNDIFIIRTMPDQKELSLIHPEKIVVCTHIYVDRDYSMNMSQFIKKLDGIEQYAETNNAEIIYIPDLPGYLKKRKDEAGMIQSDYWKAFYGSPEWKKCRDAYKKKAKGLCEMCLKEGRWTAGEFVHHKIHLSEQTINDPAVACNFDNLMLVCRDCHAKLHRKKPSQRYYFDDAGHVIINPEDGNG